MLMAQAIRPPASPVGSVLSDTHSMNPGNGASSSILPGSEEGIGGRHGFPHTLAATAVYNEWIENTADLDAGRYRFAPRRRAGDGAAKDGGAFAGAPTAGHFDSDGHPITDPKAGRRGPSCRPIELGWSRRLTGARMGFEAQLLSSSMKGISPGCGQAFWCIDRGRRRAAKSTRSASKPAFGHAAGRKCPLARATAAAILPTGWAGRTESF